MPYRAAKFPLFDGRLIHTHLEGLLELCRAHVAQGWNPARCRLAGLDYCLAVALFQYALSGERVPPFDGRPVCTHRERLLELGGGVVPLGWAVE